MSHETLMSVRIPQDHLSKLHQLSQVTGKPTNFHIQKGTKDWIETFDMNDFEREERVAAEVRMGTLKEIDTSRLAIVGVTRETMGWFEKYRRFSLDRVVSQEGGWPQDGDMDQFSKFVTSLPRPLLSLSMVVRAGIASEVSQCDLPGFTHRLESGIRRDEQAADNILNRRVPHPY